MKHALRHSLVCVSLMSLGWLALSAPGFAADSALPAKPQAQSEASQSVQPKVDKQTADAAAEKRKKLFADATAALAETQKALKALESKNNDAALKALAEVTGKLDLIVARDPKLAQTPVATDVVTYDLLVSIFHPATPLHDGAVVIQGNRVAAAACFLPLTVHPELSRTLGSRHRAAIGLSEDTDAVAIVVSEETGTISLVEGGRIRRGLDGPALRQAVLASLGLREAAVASPPPQAAATEAKR